MEPKIENFAEIDGTLTFTLRGVDVSFANAIRRTIIADIPTVVFKTMPYEENKANITANTSRLNNEILKQRLSCIPIHISDLSMPLQNYTLVINEENKTDTIMYVTTEHFKIKNKLTDTFLEESDIRKIFPPYVPPTGKGEYFIDFVRLRPKISDEILGEKINLTCEFSIGTSKEDSMFNVTGTCAYGYTLDTQKVDEELEKQKQKWKDEDKTAESIKMESANWKLLEGLRYVKKNSFDFTIQSLGVFENDELVIKACDILIDRLKALSLLMGKDELEIIESATTMDNCYDIILENEDYTIGNILNYVAYANFYNLSKLLSFCGFKKMHPHDSYGILRIAFESPTSTKETLKDMFRVLIDESVQVFKKVKGLPGLNKK